ncbi:hypothetical protein K435DRAFT_674591 [Dendrothele bispora CBS 962.96]|uniref:CHAT domain-containing protein n=1 Tax=Dendrothele bispora (strain CBS 962.96) TaxID=1314807 RepID=A0A4S8LPD8_DENBC|nr:hypothetical protein K435DRAFT_674591 [Dendrothele bispora CBS 962.96]
MTWLGASFETRTLTLAEWWRKVEALGHSIASPAEFPGYAAEVAIEAGDIPRALQWLEHGRSILWAQLLRLRAPLDSVWACNPELAGQLEKIRSELIKTSSSPESSSESQRHHDLTQAWEETIARAHQLPGLENFLQPLPLEKLFGYVKNGPVVVINCTDARTDALVVMPAQTGMNGIIHIALPEVSASKVKQWHLDLVSATQDAFTSRTDRFSYRIPSNTEAHSMKNLLRELWLMVVYPILKRLEVQVSNNVVPGLRVYWCPTGGLTFLPLHAAGDYNRVEPGHKIFDFFVSSYIPNLASFAHSQRITTSPFSTTEILVVAAPDAEGYSKIPYTDEEISRIKGRVKAVAGHSVTALSGDAATRERVVSVITRARWAHFACHGIQHPTSPMSSALMLSDKETLRLSDIASLDLPHSELAYLSACHTATGMQTLPSESLHLAAGMLLAGFSGVIATMWSIKDHYAADVADEVYRHLLVHDQATPGKHGVAAVALYLAVQKLRNSVTDKDFLSWVPYIHIGAS